MNELSLRIACIAAFLAAVVFNGPASADWTEDFSGPLTNWDEYTFDAFAPITMGVSDGKLVFDAALPSPNDPVSATNQAAGYSAIILDDPAFEDPEDVEVSCVVELEGGTEYLYGGVLARAQGIQWNQSGQPLVDGVAYAYLISGSGQGEAALYKLYDNEDDYIMGDDLEDIDPSYETRIENEPIYMKMKVTTQEVTGYPHVEAMMSFSPNFSNPFGIVDYIDSGSDGPIITGPGQIGLIGFNDYDPGPAEPASVLFDDLLIVTEFFDLGDANGDGFVNSADLDIVRANWGTSVTPGDGTMGDLSGDGVVNSADLDLVRGNWGSVYAASIPEPGICLLATVGMLLLASRRRHE